MGKVSVANQIMEKNIPLQEKVQKLKNHCEVCCDWADNHQEEINKSKSHDAVLKQIKEIAEYVVQLEKIIKTRSDVN